MGRFWSKKMTENNVEKLVELNFKKIGIDRIGKIEDYFFSIEDKQDSENELIVSFNFAPNNNKSKLFEFFDKLEESKQISEYNIDKNLVRVVYIEDEKETVDIFLNGIVNKFREIDGKCICSNCDNTENLSFYSNGNVYSLLCESCGTNVIDQFEKDKLAKNNYIKGLLASLIGALIGSAIWIIIGALGFFASIAGLAISYCAFKGYGIAKGKLTRKGIILNVIAIVIAFLFAQYAVLFIQFMKEFENMDLFGFIILTPVIFSDLEFVKSLLPDIGLGILFAFLGTYRTIINNYKSAKNSENIKVEKIEL